MKNTELSFMYKKLVKSNMPEEIFGLPNIVYENKNEKFQWLKKQYVFLISQVHPDRFSSSKDDLYIANEATQILNENYSKAKISINNSTYGVFNQQSKKSNCVEMSFDLNNYHYDIYSDHIDDDLCSVYFGQREKDKCLENICMKISKEKTDNDLLVREYEVLSSISHRSIPQYLDSVIIADGRRANIIKKIDDSYDLYSLKKHFENGFPQEHMVWIFERLLSVLGYLHLNNIIHGTIEPGNILVTPYNHNGILIDYVMSVKEANRNDAKYFGFNDFSAPEINNGAFPHPRADIYSLGKSMIYLIEGKDNIIPNSIDNRIINFLEEMIEENEIKRKDDAWKTWHELKELREKVFGAKNQFLHLNI